MQLRAISALPDAEYGQYTDTSGEKYHKNAVTELRIGAMSDE